MDKQHLKVLIYSQDGFGLGHLRRNLNVSMQISHSAPDAKILIIADSPVAPFFRLPENVEFVKIPTVIKVDAGIWRADGLPEDYMEVINLRSELIKDVALNFRPDFFLVDHMPSGALGELKWPLYKLKKHLPGCRAILGLRDILGAPDTIRRQWTDDDAYGAAAEYYHALCVYGSDDLFNLVSAYEFPAELQAKTKYCGYVCREPNGKRPETVAENLEHDLEGRLEGNGLPLIFVSGGGGSDASYFMDKFIDAAQILAPHTPFEAVIASGPFLNEDQFELLHRKAENLRVFVTRSEEDAIHYFRKAKLVITMAGYNTISEVMRFRKKAIVVPRPGPSAEQTMRSRLMAERGLFSTIHPDNLTAENMADLIADKLNGGCGMNVKMIPNLLGATNTAKLMLEAQ